MKMRTPFRVLALTLLPGLLAISTLQAKSTLPSKNYPAPATLARAALNGEPSFDLAGAIVDGAFPNVQSWRRVSTAPVNNVQVNFDYTAFAPSYLSEFGIRVRHEPTGFDKLIGGADACGNFGPCSVITGWLAAPGSVSESFSFAAEIIDGSGTWTITLLDSLDDPGSDGFIDAGAVTVSILDVAEPDDDIPSASPLVCETARISVISDPGDVDVFRINGTPGAIARIDIDAQIVGSTLDSLVTVFDSGGNVLGVDDDTAADGEPTPTLDSYIPVLLPSSGEVFAQVAALAAASSDYYRIALRCAAALDGFEPNNTGTTATPIPCNTTLHAEIEAVGDVDFYSILATPNQIVAVDVDSADLGVLDPVLGVFDSTFNLLAVSDDNPAPGEPVTLEPYLDVIAPPDGIIIIAVSSYDDLDFDGVGDIGPFHSAGPYTLEIGGFCGPAPWVFAEGFHPANPARKRGGPD